MAELDPNMTFPFTNIKFENSCLLKQYNTLPTLLNKICAQFLRQ